MRKLLICAAALSGFAIQANAADLFSDAASAKDPLPDALTYKGVTIYGTVDVGYGYQTHGAPESGAFYTAYQYVPGKATDGSQSNLIGNALEQSKIGVKIEEQIGLGFTAIGKLETGFNPWSGEISDACESLVRAAQQTQANVTSKVGPVYLGSLGAEASVDGGRCGQAFNGAAYAGLSNPLYGTLTIGRQTSLVTDGIGTYDPMKGSYALSLIGYSGGALGGIGSTETTRWDDSVKYIFTYGPAHVAGMYSTGGDDTSTVNDAYGVNAGFTYKGLSVDGFYTKENGAVNLGANTTDGYINNTWLKATVTDNEAWTAMAKYTFEFGGSFKDEGPSSKLSIFGGYNHTDMANSSASAIGSVLTTIGGYSATVYSAGYYTDRVLETEWAGATYEMGPWAFTGAYYHESQDFYKTSATSASCSNALASNCSGDINMGSFLVDYKFNKHFDIYSGVSIADVSGGFANYNGAVAANAHGNSSAVAASAIANTETVNFVSGLRLKF